MINSMTGFGKAEIFENGRKITVEMKSVNHRYLELNIKMPKKFNYLESSIRSEIRKYLERGKVDVFVSYENTEEGNLSIHYNKNLAKEYFDIYKSIGQQLEIKSDIDASVIARCQDVIVMEEKEEDCDILKDLMHKAINTASENLLNTRHIEGEHLKDDILKKLETVSDNVKFVKEKSPQIVSEYKERITQKINELLDSSQIDESRIVQEVTIFADKICIDEEFVRLESHIKAMSDALKAGGPVGRRLDFLAQEMNREANTILSKTSDPEISDVAIELKTDIEKIREQIQNIE